LADNTTIIIIFATNINCCKLDIEKYPGLIVCRALITDNTVMKDIKCGHGK